MHRMAISIQRGKQTVHIKLAGDIDMEWRDQHQPELDALCASLPQEVIFNLEDVTFMDSSGLGFIARCVRRDDNPDRTVQIVGATDIVRQALNVVGLERYVALAD